MRANRNWLGTLIVAVTFGFGSVVASTTPVKAADTIRWKIQSAYPRGDVSMELLEYFAKRAKERSNGKIRIQVYADPELVPGNQLFEATQKGTLDMLHALGAMWGGILPVGEVEFGLPYAWKIPGGENMSFDQTADALRKFFYDSGFVKLLREQYGSQGLYWLDMHTYGPIVTMSTKPIKTIADMQGKKMRMEGSWNDYYNLLGARGVNLPGTEAYMGLKLGTLDGSQWDISAITALKWYEVAPYWLRGADPEHCIGHMLVNQKSWDALPDDVKAAVAGAAEDYWFELIRIHKEEFKKVDELIAQGKVIKSEMDEDLKKLHREKALVLWDEIAKRDPAAAKAIDMIKKWRGM
jgi:TRAP-type C4-dicarboxylate transport system substrate-binding protein